MHSCALAAAPNGPCWHITFLIKILCLTPWISQVQSTGLPSISLRAQSCASSKILCSIVQSQRQFISAQYITVLRKNVSSQGCCLKIVVAERNEAILRPVSLHVSHSYGQIIFLV